MLKSYFCFLVCSRGCFTRPRALLQILHYFCTLYYGRKEFHIQNSSIIQTHMNSSYTQPA